MEEYQFLKLYYIYILKVFENSTFFQSIKYDNFMANDTEEEVKKRSHEAEEWKLKHIEPNKDMPPTLTRASFTSSVDDQSLLQIYEAFSLNIFRFVLNNVGEENLALQLCLLFRDELFGGRLFLRSNHHRQNRRRLCRGVRVRQTTNRDSAS